MKRLRFGIGRPADRSQVVDYVLTDFRSSEVPIVHDTVEKCVDVFHTIFYELRLGLEEWFNWKSMHNLVWVVERKVYPKGFSKIQLNRWLRI